MLPFIRGLTPIPRLSGFRFQSTQNYFQLFPKTFPGGRFPPATSYKDVDLKKLRKEFRALQAQHHPDILGSLSDDTVLSEAASEDVSTLLNKAYNTLKEPLSRAQYIIKTTIPQEIQIDLTNDADLAKKILTKDKTFLMDVLDIHENLECITKEAELAEFKRENDTRMQESIARIDAFFQAKDYESAIYECAKFKYWCNIDDAVRNWEAGN
ncbi:hypothetical protein BABINDRAFT_9984 [Babjeviella inositovora NRRL Y-12698]|uniref:Co-chaperone HscB C-terminal oligomerisation domain-containing protein n=1 Tax=Babjeviella inositovora NRRL Y-12698 TaxID=984486 RepID=A0A1E3QIW6_9ASCO|nr:uncharacterized protein BABINDRAFT_9984 [Babjeviella inositovora NRRL Y-12698]ODQ77646.1 hypothetical protein BABINDRAFT_9984 [Babjeviella inositovora NRRL Y-12698]